jgi:general secretion pathway protein I
VEKIELPSLNPSGDAGVSAATSAMLGQNNAGGGPGLDLSGDGGLQALGGMVGQQFGMPGMSGAPGSGTSAVGGVGAEGLLGMVMGLIYPGIKPMYEMSIRRVTVAVKWKEGPNERELPLTQFVTNPMRAGFAGSALLADGGAMDFGAPGSSATPGGTPPGGLGTGGARPGGGGTR